MEFSKEQIEKARNCKTLDEFKSLAKAEGLELSDEEAENYFEKTRIGELTDNDLASVAGGSKGQPKPKFNHGELVKDTRKPLGYRGKHYFNTGIVAYRSFKNNEWEYRITNDGYSREVPESCLVRVKK